MEAEATSLRVQQFSEGVFFSGWGGEEQGIYSIIGLLWRILGKQRSPYLARWHGPLHLLAPAGGFWLMSREQVARSRTMGGVAPTDEAAAAVCPDSRGQRGCSPCPQ